MPHTDLIQELWGGGELFNNSGSIDWGNWFFFSLKRLSRHMFKADGTDDAPEGLMCVGQNVRTVWDELASVCWLHVGGVRSGAAVMQSQHGGVPLSHCGANVWPIRRCWQLQNSAFLPHPCYHYPSSSCPCCPSTQRSVKCQNQRQENLNILLTRKLTHAQALFTVSRQCLFVLRADKYAGRCRSHSADAHMCLHSYIQVGVCVCRTDGHDATLTQIPA